MSGVTISVLRAVSVSLILLGTEGVMPWAVGSSPDVSSGESILLSYGFPVVSGLTHLCEERVYTNQEQASAHITWHAFSSDLEPGEVIKLFRQQLGDAGFNPEGTGGSWRFPVGSNSPDRVLTVSSAEKEGPHSSCKERVPSTARSVIIVSRKQ